MDEIERREKQMKQLDSARDRAEFGTILRKPK